VATSLPDGGGASRLRRILLAIVITLWACGPRAPAAPDARRSAADVEWTVYGGDNAQRKYSPLADIDAENASRLRIAWRWSSPDNDVVKRRPELHLNLFEATPVMADGVVYVATNLHNVAAIDATTGKTLWVYDSGARLESLPPPSYGFTHRGVALFRGPEGTRVLLASRGYLTALDGRTGRPIDTFGDGGRVDLTKGLRRPVDRRSYGQNSPPLVIGDVVVVGSVVNDGWGKKQAPPGDVRGFNARTGALLWTFHTVPQQGEVGNETWLDQSWRDTGHVNVWSMMSADEELGLVYLPLTSPTNDFYGGHRPGDNLFDESIVCLEAKTGKRVWHFQAVHHGLWDYDLPAAPVLADAVVDGRPRKILAQVSKQAFVYVLDRTTGAPIWPIEERPVPKSNVAGERASPTQPFPTKPPPFDRQGLTPDDLIDFTPGLRAAARKWLELFETGALFTPPSERGTLVVPGQVGGASWAGAAFDPETQMLYVPSVTNPHLVVVGKPPPDVGVEFDFVGRPIRDVLGAAGLPLTKPPYGRITAINLRTGDHAWMVPHGSGPRDHPLLRDLKLPPLGWPSRGFVLVTKTVLFAAQEPLVIREAGSGALRLEAAVREPFLRVLDKLTGRTMREIPLPANATGSPMTYRARGRQFVLVPVGGGGIPAELVALALE
jgi:quinoprotein glucose dehydrogenase